MTRALLYAALAGALTACIDTRLSLGQHDAPPTGDGDGVGDGDGDGDGDSMPPDMDATFVPPPITGGAGGMTGGAPVMPPPDAGPDLDADLPSPPASPCEERVTMSATLACAIDEGGFAGQSGGGPPPMLTTTTLSFEAPRAGQSFVRASGSLVFEAWNATFTGRIEGNLDCARGFFVALIQEGEMSMPGIPPAPFFGRLEGRLDPDTAAIAGPWWHGPDPGTPVCIGDWAAAPR